MIGLAKYLAFSRIAARHALYERGELYGRMVFFAVVLGVFSALWRAASEAGLPIAAEPGRLVWYLAATEWIVLSVPQLHVEIQEDVRRGDIAYHLPRPVSYVGSMLAQAAGTLAVRLPIMALTACGCAYAFTRQVPPLAALLSFAPFAVAATLLASALYIGVGLLAFWITDVSPVYWVVQKSLFVLGGMMLPLELYPIWLQRIAAFTPFPALLAGPAQLVLRPGTAREVWLLAARLGLWTILVTASLWLVFRRASRSLRVSGG